MGRFGQRPELSQSTGIALVRCILGKFLGVVCHCFPPRLDVPTFATRCPNDARDPSGGRWNYGRECCPVILPFRDLLHAANLRQGTDGFTSPPKEGVLRIFSPLKIRRLRPGLNPRTWVLKASTLPLDHRSQIKMSLPSLLPNKYPGYFPGRENYPCSHLAPSLRKCGASNPTYSLWSVTETSSPALNYGFGVRFDWFRTESSGGIVWKKPMNLH